MLALYRSGRQADALAAYRSRARDVRSRASGIEPGAELKALERQILDQDPALAAPPSPPPTAVEADHARRRRRIAIAAAAATVIVGVAMTAAVLLRGEATAITVEPNWVAVIDPRYERGRGRRPGRDRAWPDRLRRRSDLGRQRGQRGRQVRDAHQSELEEGGRNDRARCDADRGGVRPRLSLGRARLDGAGHADRSRVLRQDDDRRCCEDEVRVGRRHRCRGRRGVGRLRRRDTGAHRPRVERFRTDRRRTEADGCRRGRRLALGRQLRQLDRLPSSVPTPSSPAHSAEPSVGRRSERDRLRPRRRLGDEQR